ncbi:rhomboid family intramembrane serine protease [Barrientosiimonas endolithica]|uniref:Rhomboid family intramembrane serine protease n=1 Tax=Barrientosiimonas endolithica TaxID=1535208 RepID=A0ABN6YX94_9MICO|nr:rhomboid family intramembrane serine protease [Barrientosiimonas endolithica]BDZ59971.1 rhomboid family intramembrane serine protease [Barrientosiimonas endolithica]
MSDPRDASPPATGAGGEASSPPVCPRHPDRVSYVRCQRCERPMCPDCQRQASVGSQCVDCVNESARAMPRVRTVFGGGASDGKPLVTYTIIAITALVYLGQLLSPRVVDTLGYAAVLGAEQPWRMVTVALVHAPLGSGTGILHILMNMYALWFCGQYLEPMLGRARFLALYVISALGGSVGYAAFGAFGVAGGDGRLWLTGTVGASGAVFGLFAAVVILNRHLGREVGPMVGLILINMALPLWLPNIAWQAHVGGAVTGAVVAAIIAALGRDRARLQWPALGGLVVGLVALSYVLDAYVMSQVRAHIG